MNYLNVSKQIFILPVLSLVFLVTSSYGQDADSRACPPCTFTVQPAEFCALLVDNEACIGSDLTVQGDLTVCGTINASGITLGNYTFAYSAETETLGVPALTFSDIYFTDVPVINGWLFDGSTDFECTQSGNYLIQYDVICRTTDSQLTDISIIALNGTNEIAGSQSSIQQPTNNKPLEITRSFIAPFNNGEILSLQWTSGTQFVQLEANSGNSSIPTPVNGIRPSVTLTITRVS